MSPSDTPSPTPEEQTPETQAPEAQEPTASEEPTAEKTEATQAPAADEAPQQVQRAQTAGSNADSSNDDSGRRGRGGRGGQRGGGGEGEGNRGRSNRGDGGGRRNRNEGRNPAEDSEWKEKVIQIRRVTKVVKGGKKLSFRAVVVVGNGKGQVGLGIGKSSEVIGAIQKAVSAARKNLITVPVHKTTIPHPIDNRLGGSRVILRPATQGTGVIAGGAARAVLELAGVEDILSKSLGSNSPLNVARATIQALSLLRSFSDIAEGRGMSVKEMIM